MRCLGYRGFDSSLEVARYPGFFFLDVSSFSFLFISPVYYFRSTLFAGFEAFDVFDRCLQNEDARRRLPVDLRFG